MRPPRPDIVGTVHALQTVMEMPPVSFQPRDRKREGKAYRIEKPKVIMARKKLSGLSHDWEILFGEETRVVGPILSNY